MTATNTNLNSKRFSKSTTEVNSIDDYDKKIARIDLSNLRRIDKIPSSICTKFSLKKLQQSKQSIKIKNKPTNYKHL